MANRNLDSSNNLDDGFEFSVDLHALDELEASLLSRTDSEFPDLVDGYDVQGIKPEESGIRKRRRLERGGYARRDESSDGSTTTADAKTSVRKLPTRTGSNSSTDGRSLSLRALQVKGTQFESFIKDIRFNTDGSATIALSIPPIYATALIPLISHRSELVSTTIKYESTTIEYEEIQCAESKTMKK